MSVEAPIELHENFPINESGSFERRPTAAERMLAEAQIQSITRLIGSVNQVYLATLDDGTPDGQKAIYKPVSGETSTFLDLKPGDYFKRERAAYLLDQALGFSQVPVTVIRQDAEKELLVDGTPEEMAISGSLQEFVTAMPYSKVKVELGDPSDLYPEDLYKLWIFDYIIYNPDRGNPNLLFKTPGEEHGVVAIDNGLAFAPTSFSPFEIFYDKYPPAQLIEQVNSFQQDRERRQMAAELLTPLLTPREVQSCLARIELIDHLLQSQGCIRKGDFLDKNKIFCYDPRRGGML